jgi:hypothetical protein
MNKPPHPTLKGKFFLIFKNPKTFRFIYYKKKRVDLRGAHQCVSCEVFSAKTCPNFTYCFAKDRTKSQHNKKINLLYEK